MNRKVFILAVLLLSALPFSSYALPPNAALSGSTLLFGDELGTLSAVDSRTHEQLWSRQESDASCVGVPAVSGDRVVFAQATGEVSCLKVSDGSLLWRYVPPFDETATEGLNDGVIVGDGKVYAAFTSGKLRAFGLEDGRIAWVYEAKQGLRTAPAYSEGLVLLGEYDGRFSIIDAETGDRLNGGGAGGAVNTPVVSQGNVYYSAWDGSVHAVQLKDVIPLWSTKLSEPVTTSPVVAEGLVVVGTASGKVAALGRDDGAKLWEYDSQGSQLTLSVSNGRVFVSTEDGRTLMLEAKTGQLIHD